MGGTGRSSSCIADDLVRLEILLARYDALVLAQQAEIGRLRAERDEARRIRDIVERTGEMLARLYRLLGEGVVT